MDQFVRDEAISHIDYLKIDVEGHDVQVLKGGLKTILEHKPVLQIEVAKPTYVELYDFSWLKNLLGLLGEARIYFVYKDKLIEINSLDEFLGQDVIQTDIIISPLKN